MAMTDSASLAPSYSAFSRLVHWLTLLLMIALFAIAWSVDDFAQPLKGQLVMVHRSIGITVLVLTVARLVWRWVAGAPALPEELPAWQKLAGRVTQILLYGLLVAEPMIGILWSNANGRPIDFFFLGELPALIGPDKPLARTLGGLHGTVANLFLVVIGLHAAAALYHHYVRRDDVLKSMLTAKA